MAQHNNTSESGPIGDPTMELTLDDNELEHVVAQNAPVAKRSIDKRKLKRILSDNPQYIWAAAIIALVVAIVLGVGVSALVSRSTDATAAEGSTITNDVRTTQTADDALLMQLKASEEQLKVMLSELEKNRQTTEALQRQQDELDASIDNKMDEVEKRHQAQVDTILRKIKQTPEWISVEAARQAKEQRQAIESQRVQELEEE